MTNHTAKDNLHEQQEHEKRKARIVELDRELFDLRNELAVNKKLDKPHLIKAKRKEKARILTAMTQELISREDS